MKKCMIANELASMPEKALIDEKGVAAMFEISTRTAARWVATGEFPPPARVGGRKFWFAGKILAHIEQRIAESERLATQRNKAAMRAEVP